MASRSTPTPTASPQSRSPIGLVAGAGNLPMDMIHVFRAQNQPYVVAALQGFADPQILMQNQDFEVPIGQLGTFIEKMQSAGVSRLLQIGKIKRPALKQLKTDAKGAAFIAKVTLKAGLAGLGDNALLEAIRDELGKSGFTLIGVEDVTRDLFVETGQLGNSTPDQSMLNNFAFGFQMAKDIGRLDIGQAVVVNDGEVLAVEAAEGTDAMLLRLKDLGRDLGQAVLVKTAKPQQDRRLDLPAIGLTSIENAVAAGIGGIALETKATLLLNRQACIEKANDAGLVLMGLGGDEKGEAA